MILIWRIWYWIILWSPNCNFVFILTTCLRKIVLILWGKILDCSLMRVKGLTHGNHFNWCKVFVIASFCQKTPGIIFNEWAVSASTELVSEVGSTIFSCNTSVFAWWPKPRYQLILVQSIKSKETETLQSASCPCTALKRKRNEWNVGDVLLTRLFWHKIFISQISQLLALNFKFDLKSHGYYPITTWVVPRLVLVFPLNQVNSRIFVVVLIGFLFMT